MDIHDISNRLAAVATAGQTTFAFGFLIFDPEDIEVEVAGVPAIYASPALTANEYDVDIVEDGEGGSITFGAGLTLGQSVTIQRNVPIERVGSYPSAGPFAIKLINETVDRLVVHAQDVRAKADAATLGDPGDLMLRADLASDDGPSLIKGLRHIMRNYVDDIGGFVEGSSGNAAVNAAALNAQLALGGEWRMRPGGLYRAAGLLLRTTSALVFEGSTKPIIYHPVADFTRASNLEAGRYAANGCGIRVFGGQNDGSIDGLAGTVPVHACRLENFIQQFEVAENRNLVGIYGRNATSLTVGGIEIFGLPLGAGVQLDSVRGDSLVEDLYVRDCGSNTTLLALVTNAPNITGLGVGGNEVAGIGCEGIVFSRIRLKALMTGPDFQEANTKNDGDGSSWTRQRANQSDGINVSGALTKYCKFSDVDIDTVGEGMDIFGTDNEFARVSIRNADTFGVKFIHGGSRNLLDQVHIERVGLGGFIFNGTNAVACEDNRISNFSVKSINPNAIWSAGNGGGTSTGAASTYGASFVSGSFLAKNNRLVNGLIDGGGTGTFGYLDNAGAGSKNYGLDIDVRNTLSERILVQGATDGRVRQVGGAAFVKQVDATGTVIA